MAKMQCCMDNDDSCINADVDNIICWGSATGTGKSEIMALLCLLLMAPTVLLVAGTPNNNKWLRKTRPARVAVVSIVMIMLLYGHTWCLWTWPRPNAEWTFDQIIQHGLSWGSCLADWHCRCSHIHYYYNAADWMDNAYYIVWRLELTTKKTTTKAFIVGRRRRKTKTTPNVN